MGSNLNNHKALHTSKYIQKVTREEWLTLFTIENLGPIGSKGKVFKIKRN